MLAYFSNARRLLLEPNMLPILTAPTPTPVVYLSFCSLRVLFSSEACSKDDENILKLLHEMIQARHAPLPCTSIKVFATRFMCPRTMEIPMPWGIFYCIDNPEEALSYEQRAQGMSMRNLP